MTLHRRTFICTSAVAAASIGISAKGLTASMIEAIAEGGHAQPPYLGVSYYPEVAGDKIDSDIAKMGQIGVNHVRFGEFAWSRMEPREGEFDFSLQQTALRKFANAGIAVVLCTPTAAPPIWLTEKHPDVLRVNAMGLKVGHGGRRQYCPNSTAYREYCRRIADAMGKAFAVENGVIGWQIDNELWGECYCANCQIAFSEWLKARYGTAVELNRRWLTVLWSQEYQNLEQVPLPNQNRVGDVHHPSLVRAYNHFLSDSYVSFLNEQVEVLRRQTTLPITSTAHNINFQKIDLTQLFRRLDVVGVDTYAGAEDLARYAFECDWMRGFDKPFAVAETSATYSTGSALVEDGQFVQRPGSLRAKMWLSYALGADLVSFWLWRNHWAGQELEHGSLLYQWGEETANTGEIRQVVRELRDNLQWLRNTRPKRAGVAMHFSVPSQWIFESTPASSTWGFYDKTLAEMHRTLLRARLARDVIHPEAQLEGYRVLFTPLMPVISDELLLKIRKFVELGGIWILGPLSAYRTEEATAHVDAAYGGELEKWLGIHVRHRVPVGGVRLVSGRGDSACRLWCDAYVSAATHKVLARYEGGAIDGMAAVLERKIGQGKVVLLGTLPDPDWLGHLLSELAGGAQWESDAGVDVVQRLDSQGHTQAWVAVNTTSAPRKVKLEAAGSVTLGPYGVLIHRV
jgi:beta-galactosidase